MSGRGNIWWQLCLGAACLVSTPSLAWESVRADIGLEIVVGKDHEPPKAGRKLRYSAARLHQRGLKLDLVTLNELLSEKYRNYGPGNVVLVDDGTKRTSKRPTVETAWELLMESEEAADIYGIVPIGFSEVAGSADVAGFVRSASMKQEYVYSAPNLDTLLCLNDVEKVVRLEEEGNGETDFDLPFLFRIERHFASYRYLDDLKVIDFGSASHDNRFKETFDLCQNMIQTGFRVLDPVHIVKSRSGSDRLAYGMESGKKYGSYPLNVMVLDRKQRFSFVNFETAVSPYEAGLAIGSDEFFGEKCKPSPERNPLARSCEIWAVTVSAFDRAGMVFRTSPDPAADPIWIGDGNVITPAVLVLRRRELGDTQEAPSDSLYVEPR